MAETAAAQAAALFRRNGVGSLRVGLVHFRAGDYLRSLQEMEQALELEPNSLWPSFYRGCCAYHLGQLEEATTAFSVCIALAPELPGVTPIGGLA